MSRRGASSESESRHGFSTCSFFCPYFCLALKVPVRDEMFGTERRARVHAARSEAPLRQQRPPMYSSRPCLARSRRRCDCVLFAPYASRALLSLPHFHAIHLLLAYRLSSCIILLSFLVLLVLLLFPARSQRVSSCRLSLPPSLPSFLMRSPRFPPLFPLLPHSVFPSLSPFRRCSFRPCLSPFRGC